MNRSLVTISFLYIIQLFLAVLNPYNYFPISINSILIYTVFIIFLLLYSIPYKSRRKEISFYEYKNIIIFYVNFYLIIALLLFSTTLLIKLKTGLTSQELRDLYFFAESRQETSIFNYLFLPLSLLTGVSYFAVFIFTLNLNYKVKYNNKLLIKIVIALILIDSATSGRMAFFYIFFIFFFYLLSYGSNYFKIYFLKKKYIVFFAVVLTFFIYMTISRLNDFSVFEFLYSYLIGPYYLFDYSINDVQGVVYLEDNRFGYSFMSLDWVFFGILRLFDPELVTLFTISDKYLSHGYYLNNNYGINAFYTIFTYFFIDFGYLAPFFVIFYHYILILFAKFCRCVNLNALDLFLSFFLLIGFRENILNSPTFLVTLLFLLFFNPYKLIQQ